ESLECALHDEGADAGWVAIFPLLQIGPRENQEIVGQIRERDPRLLASQDVAIPLLNGGRLNRSYIAAGGGLRQAVARQLRAGRLRHEVTALLVFIAPRQ